MIGTPNIHNMTTDIKGIVNCQRRIITHTIDGIVIYCKPPTGIEKDVENPHCFQHQLITIDICKKCADPNTFLLPPKKFSINKYKRKFPPIRKQIKTYKRAVTKWLKSNLSIRSNSEVKDIFEKHCKYCNDYDSKKHRCTFCGCKVKPKGIAIFNKIKMKTEHCPKGLW